MSAGAWMRLEKYTALDFLLTKKIGVFGYLITKKWGKPMRGRVLENHLLECLKSSWMPGWLKKKKKKPACTAQPGSLAQPMKKISNSCVIFKYTYIHHSTDHDPYFMTLCQSVMLYIWNSYSACVNYIPIKREGKNKQKKNKHIFKGIFGNSCFGTHEHLDTQSPRLCLKLTCTHPTGQALHTHWWPNTCIEEDL